ncbi:hypothetical protein MHYP_G00159490 [Metynnis hypsauchen]
MDPHRAAAVPRGFKKCVLEVLLRVQHKRLFHPARLQPSAPSRTSTKVKINVGLMVIQKGDLRPQRGKTISLTTDPDISA